MMRSRGCTRATVFLCVSVLVSGLLLLQGLHRRRPAHDMTLDVNNNSQWYAVHTGEVNASEQNKDDDRTHPFTILLRDKVRHSEEVREAELDSVFTLANYFTFPHPNEYKPVSELMQASWWAKLQEYLIAVGTPKQVVIVEADMMYLGNILNWLIVNYLVLNKPIDNVLILTPDEVLYDLLRNKGFSTLYMPFDSYLTDPNPKDYGKGIWLMRFGILRLLNHWGISVVNFDSDAVPLKNVQELWNAFKDQDIVASLGTWGDDHWTICMGAIYFRNTTTTELFWKTMQTHNVHDLKRTGDDQYRLNDLISLSWDIKWDVERPIPGKPIFGQTTKNNLKVVILPETKICRWNCKLKEARQYYVWHQRIYPTKDKMRSAIVGGVWHLRPDWEKVLEKNTDLTGKDWLSNLRVF